MFYQNGTKLQKYVIFLAAVLAISKEQDCSLFKHKFIFFFKKLRKLEGTNKTKKRHN